MPTPDASEADSFRLDGRVAVITGGTSGIGMEIGRRFLKRGAVVALAGTREPAAWSGTFGPLEAQYEDRVSAHQVDIRSMESCRRLIDAVVNARGGVDVLVNSAGINLRSSLADTSEDEWLRIMDVNLNGTYRMCRSAFEALRDGARPAVVNLASTAGEVAVHAAAAYGVSKAAIMHMTRILALEWAPHGIRVNAVAPTIVPSPMTDDIIADEERLAQKVATIPLGRMVQATEVADGVAFLASGAASAITGHTLFVDGGVVVT